MGRVPTYTIHDYMTIEALEDGLTAKLSRNACEYCIDGSMEWIALPANTATPAINTGQIISFRAEGITPQSSYGIGTFTISKKCNLLGNCTAMLYGDDARFYNTMKSYGFKKLFEGCTSIVNVSSGFLPYINLASNCYNAMFSGCTSLVTTPSLPAKKVGYYSYANMFLNCTGLIIGPELPMTSCDERGCGSMFSGCTSLERISSKKLNGSGVGAFSKMFYGCTSLIEAPDLNLPSSSSYICEYTFYNCTSLVTPPKISQLNGSYSGQYMFRGCTSLKSAPVLKHGTYLPSNYCYYGMFWGCTSLTEAPELPASGVGTYAYAYMFRECTSLVEAPELPATNLNTGCYQYMFGYCTNLVKAPELPATTLAESCYNSMFCVCTSLVEAPELPATTLAPKCYRYMFEECSALISAPSLPAPTLVQECYQYMFQNSPHLSYIEMLAKDTSATDCLTDWVNGVSTTGTFVKHWNADWDVSGVSGVPEGWELKFDFYPVECTSLTITAPDVSARATSTTITYTATISGYDNNDNPAERTITKTTKSDTFPQNTSYTNVVTHEISVTYMGVTATTTITQGVWKDQSYAISLNDNWRLSTEISNPDSSLYNGVYESFSNRSVHNTAATMYIDIVGYETFKMYIRSNAESGYDYVMVSQLDKSIGNGTSYSDTTLVKANTRNIQNRGTTIDSYTLVEFTGIDGDEHRITVVYRKDGSANNGTDSGYVLIPID